MTVDQLWEEVKGSLGMPTVPADRLRSALAKLVVTPEGRTRFVQGIQPEQKLPGKPILLRQFARLMEPAEGPSSGLGDKDRTELLDQSTRAARTLWRIDATYWMFLWLRLKSGQAIVVTDSARDLKALNEGCRGPQDLVKKLTAMQGWADFPRDRWIELIDKARANELSPEFRSQMQKVVEVLKGSPEPAVPPRAVQAVPGGQVRTPEPPPAVAVASQPTASTSIQSDRPRGIEPTSSAVMGKAAAAKPIDEKSTQALPQPPVMIASQKEPHPVGMIPSAGDTSAPTPAEVRKEPNEAKEARPRRSTTPKKSTNKDASVATPQSDPANNDGATNTSDPEQLKPRGAVRASQQPAVVEGELPAVLADLTVAVRAVSGKIDQIVSRTGEGSSVEKRLIEFERRLAGVERTLGQSQTNAHRAQEEADRLRERLEEREKDLLDGRRERDEATVRAEDLTRRLAAANARINAAESRADQNIHEALRERDSAVLTFKAKLWDTVQAQLSDVTDPILGEVFASTEEEVLTIRLRSIRDALRAEGVPPL